MDSITNHPEVLAVLVALPLFGILARIFGASFRRIAKWYLYVAVFAVLVVMDSMFFPFIGGKDYFFRSSVQLSLIFFLLAWAFEMRDGELKHLLKTTFKKPLAIAVSAFAGAFLLATAFAYDSYAAFWSNYERGEGGFMMVHYYLFFLLLVLLLKTEDEWKNLFKFSLAAAGLLILYGIGGNYMLPTFIGPYAGGGAPTNWWHILIDGRFQGTLGNPAYVAPYLIFAMFFASWLWVRRMQEGKTSKALAWGYWILMAVFLFFFMIAQTRGAFLGIVAGAYLLLVYIGYSVPRYRKFTLAILAAAFLVGGIAVYYVHHTFLANPSSTFLSLIPGIRLLDLPLNGSVLAIAGIGGLAVAALAEFAREKKKLWWALLALAILSGGGALYAKQTGHFPSFADPTTSTRFWVWGEAWQGFLERPVFGWGPENFTAVYDKYFNPNFFVPQANTETWYDRAHSVYFDYLSETGAVGLLSYLSIFAVFYWQFAKRKRAEAEGHQHAVAAAVERGLIFAVPAAYLVQGVAIFDVLPMYVPLLMFLGFAYYYLYERKSEPAHEHGAAHEHHHG